MISRSREGGGGGPPLLEEKKNKAGGKKRWSCPKTVEIGIKKDSGLEDDRGR